LKQVSITERSAKAKYVIALGMFGNRLHNGAIDDDQMLGRRFNRPTLARIARVEQKSCALQAYPVAFPAALSSQFDLMLFAQ
jgi:hypothetical protein